MARTMVNDKPFYLKDISEERRLRINGREQPDPNADILWNQAITAVADTADKEKLLSAFRFAKQIPYRHEGLSSDIYFTHPMRTAAMALLCEEQCTVDFGIVGLLHNVLEVSDISREVLSANFGENVATQIVTLTVNRDLQWDEQYKRSYYDEINSQPVSCRVVKVFDKLDNLFVLGLNSDEQTREKYLSEIKLHVLPIAEKDLPTVYAYMCRLVEDTERIGFFG
jgi:(p)ppGpp synthase/HD superfamily hydrolase